MMPLSGAYYGLVFGKKVTKTTEGPVSRTPNKAHSSQVADPGDKYNGLSDYRYYHTRR
jgi:hypothetical protein